MQPLNGLFNLVARATRRLRTVGRYHRNTSSSRGRSACGILRTSDLAVDGFPQRVDVAHESRVGCRSEPAGNFRYLGQRNSREFLLTCIQRSSHFDA
jgi:hypothetical protein